MKRVLKTICMVLLTISLVGCVSGRYQQTTTQVKPEETMPVPTIAVPEQQDKVAYASMLPTWTPADRRTYSDFTGPSDPDSDAAIPRAYLEALGLVPVEHGINLFYADVSEIYGNYFVTTDFTNYWRPPDGSAGTVLGVDQYQFTMTTTYSAEYFLIPARADLMVYGLMFDIHDLSEELPLGSTSFVLQFSREGSQIYVAQFSWGTSVGTVIISGTDDLSQDQAFEMILLAATTVGFDPNYSGELDEANQGFEGLLGKWSGRQRGVEILPDGSGSLSIFSGCCDGVIYSLEVDMRADPVTATITDKEYQGGYDPKYSMDIGEEITIIRMPDIEGDYVVVTIPQEPGEDDRQINFCQIHAMRPCGE